MTDARVNMLQQRQEHKQDQEDNEVKSAIVRSDSLIEKSNQIESMLVAAGIGRID